MTDSSFSFQVKSGILDILYQHSFLRNGANLLLALVIAVCYWSSVDGIILFAWLFAAVLLFGIRQYFYYRFIKLNQKSEAQLLLFDRLYTIALIISAIHWSILMIFITPLGSPGLNMATLLVLSGVTSAGYLSSCLIGRYSAGFLVLLVSAVGYRLIVNFPNYSWAYVVILTSYCLFISQVAVHFRKALIENLRMFHEKDELAKELDEARKRAEEVSEEKTRFLGVTSHEIRTSVNGIVGIMQVLEDSMQTESGLDHLATMKKSSSDLLNHLNNLLDFNKIEIGKLTLESKPFDWQEVVRDAVNLFEGTASRKGIKLKLELGESGIVWLEGDATRLGQIIKNLLSNAIKFTPQGYVTIVASAERIGGTRGKLHVELEDTGKGVEASRIEQLFEPFVQEDDSIHGLYGGSGLGLSICQRISTLMGTKIHVESKVGRGSRFWLEPEFEIVPTTEVIKAIPTVSDESSVIPSKKCLVVQDDAMSQKVGRLLLEKIGMLVDVVESGEKAVECVEKEAYDFVFMDIKMGGISGIEATKQIRGKALNHAQPKIIALTGSVMESERAVYKQTGMDGCLPKPLMLDDLKAVFFK